jgi:exonuclease SbcD
MNLRNLRFLLLADSHLGFDYPLHRRSKRPSRGEDFFRNFAIIMSVACREKVDALIHLGDVFHRSRPPDIVIERAFGGFHQVADMGIPVYIVPGNHERSWLPQTLFSVHPNIHIFTQASCFILEKNGQKVAINGIPHIRSPIEAKFTRAVATLGKERSDFNILCLHQTIAGVKAGPGNRRFRSGPDVIPRALLPNWVDLIVSGHFHRPQYLYDNVNPPILYVGSIERVSMAEAAEAKGYRFLDISSENRFKFTHESLPTRPYVQINISKTTPLRQLKALLQLAPANALIRPKIDSQLKQREIRNRLELVRRLLQPGQIMIWPRLKTSQARSVKESAGATAYE